MPKKTRQEKILAKLRRLENKQEPGNESFTTQSNQIPPISTDFRSENFKSTVSDTNAIWDYSYVYKELTKSLLFAAVAVIFQIFLAIFILN